MIEVQVFYMCFHGQCGQFKPRPLQTELVFLLLFKKMRREVRRGIEKLELK